MSRRWFFAGWAGMCLFAYSAILGLRGVGLAMDQFSHEGGRLKLLAWFWWASFALPLFVGLLLFSERGRRFVTVGKLAVLGVVFIGAIHAYISKVFVEFEGSLDGGLVSRLSLERLSPELESGGCQELPIAKKERYSKLHSHGSDKSDL